MSLDPEIKGPVFDALVELVPDARIPGRPAPRRAPQEPRVSGATRYLDQAREAVAEDPHEALNLVDRAFKSRPDFETWFGAYSVRMQALVALEENSEALRTYERFRAKLYRREALDSLEALLLDEEGPVTKLLDETACSEQLVDLYEVMPDRETRFAEACISSARSHLDSEEPARWARAVALLHEAASKDADAASEALEAAQAKADEAGVMPEAVPVDEIKDLVQGEEDPIRLLVVGGDEGRRPHVNRLQEMAKTLGFEGSWIFTGARPPYKTMREIERAAQDADAILLHHSIGADLKADVQGIGEKLDIAVREAVWLGTVGVEREVLHALKDAFIE